MQSRIIFHIDVNNAYLSWTAVHRLQNGSRLDIRNVPSVIGGDENSRHGIVLAKSQSAKAFGIKTGNPLMEARTRCPNLLILPANYHLYMQASASLLSFLEYYSPHIQQFSIDECFLDYTQSGISVHQSTGIAHEIKMRIQNQFGFTVNIGIGPNKLLAKMASDFKKPNRVHTLFHSELPDKLWPLPVEDLFMVGRQTGKKLKKLGIHTIGELANADLDILEHYMKSHGRLIQSYAKGIDSSLVKKSNFETVKGVGNSTTISFDVGTREVAHRVILSLCETIGMRLRALDLATQLVSISIVTNEFQHASHQKKLALATNSTNQIFDVAVSLFDTLWDLTPIRKLGVRTSEVQDADFAQLSLLEELCNPKDRLKDLAIDGIRTRYGKNAIFRACFLDSGLSPMSGGISESDYPAMTNLL